MSLHHVLHTADVRPLVKSASIAFWWIENCHDNGLVRTSRRAATFSLAVGTGGLTLAYVPQFTA